MENRRVDLTVIGTKAKSKAELYRMLAVEGGLYLPPQEYTNMDFISDIWFNDRKVGFNHSYSNALNIIGPIFKWSACLFCASSQGAPNKGFDRVSCYECDGDEYLPADYTERAPPRDWIANICNN